MTTMSDNIKRLYDAGLITIGAVGVSLACKKLLGEPLGTPTSVNGILKLAVAVGASSMIVNYLEMKGYVPKTPYKG